MLGEQANREYHSGDPEPEAHCVDCGVVLYESDYSIDIDGETFCWDCRNNLPHDLHRCGCATCDEDRAELGWVRS